MKITKLILFLISICSSTFANPLQWDMNSFYPQPGSDSIPLNPTMMMKTSECPVQVLSGWLKLYKNNSPVDSININTLYSNGTILDCNDTITFQFNTQLDYCNTYEIILDDSTLIAENEYNQGFQEIWEFNTRNENIQITTINTTCWNTCDGSVVIESLDENSGIVIHNMCAYTRYDLGACIEILTDGCMLELYQSVESDSDTISVDVHINNQSIEAIPLDGQSPFQFEWTGPYSFISDQNPIIPPDNGLYSVKVTDALGNCGVFDRPFILDIQEQSPNRPYMIQNGNLLFNNSSHIQIFNANGQLILDKNINSNEIIELNPGINILRITYDNGKTISETISVIK